MKKHESVQLLGYTLNSHRRRKFIEERSFVILMVFATILVVSALFLIIAAVMIRGIPALSWKMISEIPKGGYYLGKDGGILNAILGSLWMVIGSAVLGILFTLPVVLYIHIYLNEWSFMSRLVRLLADVLLGIPSIVYGAFGFALMVWLGMRTSLLAGIIVLTILIIPMMIRAVNEVIRLVSQEMKDATLSLGATRLEMAFVVLRQISSGIMTAIMLSAGRAIGDAASVLFTSGYTDNIPRSLSQPAATLPLAIFFQLSSPIPKVQDRAYAAAVILTLIVLIMSIFSRYFNRKFSRFKIL